MMGSTPQPEVHIKAVTTPLVAELFESTFQKQMRLNRAAKAKVCTCKACQSNNCGRCERCKKMASFGGILPDSSIICLESQCLIRQDQEIVLGDDEADDVGRRRVKVKVQWEGPSKRTDDGKVVYENAVIKFGSGKETRISSGSFLLIAPDNSEHKSVPHYPCRVLYLLSRELNGEVFKCAHVQWFCRSEHTVLGRTGDPREWFLIDECEDVDLNEVSKLINIEQVVTNDLLKWKKNGGTKEAILSEDVGGKDGWWKMKYEPEFGRFSYPSRTDVELKLNGKCHICEREELKLREDEIEVSKDGNSIRVKNVWYHVGQFIMLEDETIRFKIPKKVPKVYPKAKVDPKVYPEHWRKRDEYEGDHHDTWDPFQIVRLEQIVNKNDVYLRVRKLYRPHDTHLVHEEARTKAYTCLYWTEEIARMHPTEVAKRTGKVSMESIVAPAWVKGQSDGDVEKLIEWTDDGEDRFFISEAYNSDIKRFTTIDNEVVQALKLELETNPAPVLEEIAPLACLDI